MKTYTLASGVTGTGAQTAAAIESFRPGNIGIVQIKASASCSVQVQGSLNGSDWVDLLEDALTASGAINVSTMPQMRVNVGSNSGTVDVWMIA